MMETARKILEEDLASVLRKENEELLGIALAHEVGSLTVYGRLYLTKKAAKVAKTQPEKLPVQDMRFWYCVAFRSKMFYKFQGLKMDVAPYHVLENAFDDLDRFIEARRAFVVESQDGPRGYIAVLKPLILESLSDELQGLAREQPVFIPWQEKEQNVSR